MKELNAMQMDNLNGGALRDCAAAAGWGGLAILSGATGVGLSFGWGFLFAGAASLANCIG